MREWSITESRFLFVTNAKYQILPRNIKRVWNQKDIVFFSMASRTTEMQGLLRLSKYWHITEVLLKIFLTIFF